jgi:oleate hydratase
MNRENDLDAWILGSGISSLTAAVHLIQEAHVPPSRIHILEKLSVAGGTTVSYGDAEHGYDFRAGVRPQFNDMCMDTLLSLVPSLSDPNRTVRDEIYQYVEGMVIPKAQTRFLTHTPHGVGLGNGRKMGLGVRDRLDLFKLASKSERAIGRARICDFFGEGFFRSGYWLSLATACVDSSSAFPLFLWVRCADEVAYRFGLKPTHSAAEFRRYLHRFNDLHALNDPHVLDFGKYNVHESIMVPVARFLQAQGVDFRFNTTICDILFAHDNPDDPTEPTRVTAIQILPARERGTSIRSRDEQIIQLSPADIVIVTLGSIYSSILTGNNTRSPPCLERVPTTLTMPDDAGNDTSPDEDSPIDSELDENWLLWLELCTKHPKFGNAYNFCTRIHESRIESFTITFSSPEFFTRLAETTGNDPGPNTILTLRDSSWLITLRIPAQPVFPDQPANIEVCWGYALHPDKVGDYVSKPMLYCSGEEILTEILAHLRWEPEQILENAITIPCIQPRAASTLLPRDPEDRPTVIPKGMHNMAVIGPFVEIPDEVVVTTDYSVRGAQMAVRGLMGLGGSVRKSKKASAISLLGLL